MCASKKKNTDISDLESRITYLEEINRLTMDALDQAVRLGDFQTSINKLHSPTLLLEETRNRILTLIPFESLAFYLVDESNSEFFLFSYTPDEPECREMFEKEMEGFIEQGTFAWAIREQRPLFLPSTVKNKKILLHVMTTSSRVRGMFAGLLTRGEMDVPLVSLSLMSIILRHSANALESYELYSMIKNINNNLEQMVAERTSELESSREQLRHAQKMEALGRLAGGVAHDFNNILTAITMASEVSLNYPNMDPRVDHKFREILQLSERATNLTRQLLAVSRKQIIKPTLVDIGLLARNLFKMLKRLISVDISLDINTAENLLAVKADPGQVEQVLMNLVVNARDAIADRDNVEWEKRITIDISQVLLGDHEVLRNIVSRQGNYILIRVSDTGLGIDIDVISRIFEPFFTTKSEGKGTGLGLATVYGIIKQNNGGITVQSAPGRGSSFNVFWPCSETSQAVALETLMPMSQPGRGEETILIVEDDHDVRKALDELLEGLGYTVLSASNGKIALDRVNSHHEPIDLVITDVMMPVMDGRRLAEALMEIIPDIKIIYTTGYNDNPLSITDSLTSNSRLVQKPYTISGITKLIRELLENTV